MGDAEWMYENDLDPFHRKDENTGELVEWDGGLNPAYEDDEDPCSLYDESGSSEPLEVNMFHTFELAKAWAKENSRRYIIKSPDRHGYIVKESLSALTANSIKEQRNKYSETRSNVYRKRKSFKEVTVGFRTKEDNLELFKSYWTIFKKKWRLLIDFCLNYRNELEDFGLYQSIDINKSEEISGIANDLVDEFFAACKEIDLGHAGWENITSKLLTLTGERLNVSTWWRHVADDHGVRTQYVFYKRDMKADFIFSEANKTSKEEQYSEYLDHHMLYIFTRAIPVDYSNVYPKSTSNYAY